MREERERRGEGKGEGEKRCAMAKILS